MSRSVREFLLHILDENMYILHSALVGWVRRQQSRR